MDFGGYRRRGSGGGLSGPAIHHETAERVWLETSYYQGSVNGRGPSEVEIASARIDAALSLRHPHVFGALAGGTAEDRGGVECAWVALDPSYEATCALRSVGIACEQVEPVTFETAAFVGTRLLEGLSAAHQLGLHHGRVIGRFMRLDAEGDIRLSGFVRGAAEEASHYAKHFIHATPERVRGAPFGDARSDLWDVGVALHHLVAGRHPLAAPEPYQWLAHLAADEEPPRLDTRDVPAAFAELVGRLLRFDPSRRPGSAEEVVEVLASMGIDERTATRELSRRHPTGREPRPPTSAPASSSPLD